MHQLIYPALFCATALCYAEPAAVQPLTSVPVQNNSTDWKQANQKVAELGGWQYYASETDRHQGMDHSKHSMPMNHSGHTMPVNHSGHTMPVNHSGHTMPVNHSGHTMPMDHSKHHNHQQMDHSEHQRAKTGDEHEHHH